MRYSCVDKAGYVSSLMRRIARDTCRYKDAPSTNASASTQRSASIRPLYTHLYFLNVFFMATLTVTSSRAFTYSDKAAPQDVLLRARPYARYAGYFTLVPLLPKRPPLPPLPEEVWRRGITIIIDDEKVPTSPKDKGKQGRKDGQEWSRWSLALVCKEMKVRLS